MDEIGDREYEMKEELDETETECNTVKTDYEKQIGVAKENKGSAAAEMMEATKSKQEAEAQAGLKKEELETLAHGFETQIKECDNAIKELEETKYGCASMRSELQKLAGKRPFYQDCEVSDWVDG